MGVGICFLHFVDRWNINKEPVIIRESVKETEEKTRILKVFH